MLRSCLTWAPVSAMGSRFLCMGRPQWGLNLRELSHDSAGTAWCGARLPSSQRMRMPGGKTMQALDGLRAGYGDRFPGDKRPSDFADVVEHVTSLRYALGSRSPAWGVLDHVVGDIVAQAVNSYPRCHARACEKSPPRPPQDYRRCRGGAIQNT